MKGEGRLVDVEAAYRRYFPVIREKCRRMLNDFAEADDVAQETFVRLWRASLSDEDPRSVVAWIYRTSTRLAVDRMRERRQAAGEEEAAALASLAAGSDDALATRRALKALAQRLPAGELEVLLLHRLDGLGQQEIAEVSMVSQRTVRRWLRKVEERVARLRREISP